MLQRFAIVLSAAGLAMTVACSQSDPGITTAVKAKMAADDTVKASEINVDTGVHVVTLNGIVATRATKDRAVSIARSTDGVTSVVDDLVIGPMPAATTGKSEEKIDIDATESAVDKAGIAISDAAITTEVKAKFLAEPGVSGLKIDVDTDHGVVTLTGNVKSKAEADKAVSIARKSSGVNSVVSDLRIE